MLCSPSVCAAHPRVRPRVPPRFASSSASPPGPVLPPSVSSFRALRCLSAEPQPEPNVVLTEEHKATHQAGPNGVPPLWANKAPKRAPEGEGEARARAVSLIMDASRLQEGTSRQVP